MIELGHLTDRKPPFKYAAYTRVAFSDTDAQGVVYYGRYLPYFDLARTEYHRHLGEIHLRGQFAMSRSPVLDAGAPSVTHRTVLLPVACGALPSIRMVDRPSGV